MTSQGQFWQILQAYGSAIMPVQVVLYVAAAVVAIWLALGAGRRSSLAAKAFFAVAFAWNAIAFYLTLGSGMAGGSGGNYAFGAVFLIVSILFGVDLYRDRMRFAIPADRWERYGLLILTVLVFCYPVFGVLRGHTLASLIVPGAFPCPTTALALLLLTMALPRVDKAIYVLLLVCAVPFTPFFQIARFGVYEDSILLASGLYALVLLIKSLKDQTQAKQPA
jgi:Family of unknown function (DUF6064)